MRVRSHAIAAPGATLAPSGCGVSGTVTRTSAIVAPRVAVTITSPAPAAAITDSSLTVTETVAPSDAKVNVAGSLATVSAGWRFPGRASAESRTTTIEVIGQALDRPPTAAALVLTNSMHVSAGSASGLSGTSATPVSIPTNSTSCARELSAEPNTSRVILRNVQAAYERKGGGRNMVWSPVTKERYAMTCAAGAVIVICHGASRAYVHFERK